VVGDINTLHDIITPEPIEMYPFAKGWVILILLLLALLLSYAINRYLKYKKNRYRREATKEWKSLKKAKDIKALISLNKRVAISAYGRDEVAILSGNEWWDFMQSHSSVKLDSDIRELIDDILYSQRELTPREIDTITLISKEWIDTHFVEEIRDV